MAAVVVIVTVAVAVAVANAASASSDGTEAAAAVTDASARIYDRGTRSCVPIEAAAGPPAGAAAGLAEESGPAGP